MKNLLFLTIVLPIGIIGCATNTYDRGDAAARSLQDAAAEVQIQSRQLNFTMSAIESLVNKPAVDLRPQFQQFSANLDRLQASARRNDKAAQTAAERYAAYLQIWDRQITNINYEVVRSRSEARLAEVTDNFKAVNRRYLEARTVMRPLLAYLHDIRRALGSDLTIGGLTSVKPIVANAAENARKVQVALGRLSDDLAKSGARVSPVAVHTVSSRTSLTSR